jgi:hypothetical protein
MDQTLQKKKNFTSPLVAALVLLSYRGMSSGIYPITQESDLAKEIVRIANRSTALGYKRVSIHKRPSFDEGKMNVVHGLASVTF